MLLATINIAGGFLVTHTHAAGCSAVATRDSFTIRALAYLVAGRALHPEPRAASARRRRAHRGNGYGMVGMLVAVLCTALALVLPDGFAMPTVGGKSFRAWARCWRVGVGALVGAVLASASK